MHARLTAILGEADPSILDFSTAQCVTLGRSTRSTIVLHDERASREHAEIRFTDGHWILRNFNTRNGTRVDGGARIDRPVRLVDGQEIGIAELRLRFQVVTAAKATPDRPTPPAGLEPGEAVTTFQVDELALLHEFMTTAVEEADAAVVVRNALLAVRQLTGATLCGFLSLDPERPLPRIVEPEDAAVNAALSKQLTQRVQRDGRRVWLKEDLARLDHSDSLLPFNDAVCVPLRAEGVALGALHAYNNTDRFFTQRQVRLCEMIANFTASHLARLQLCRSLEAENTRLRSHAADADDILGDSPAVRDLRQMIARAAPCPSTVLIQGETGSGKELVALALHRQSPRGRGPFVVVNCGAIVPTLLESELFGHRDRAFTDARRHQGYFQQADNGTLFLDEVGDMTLDCQVKVLRVIEGKPFRPVGEEREVRTDVRVVAATHKDLTREVAAGRFRHDLYYRLCVICLTVPPLRERLGDLPDLAEHFIGKYAAQINKRKLLAPEALKRLAEHDWPGNIRELRTVLESAVMLSEGEVIGPRDLRLLDAPSGEIPLDLVQLEEYAIRKALQRTGGNASAAARLVGLSRETLGLKCKKYAIDVNALRGREEH